MGVVYRLLMSYNRVRNRYNYVSMKWCGPLDLDGVTPSRATNFFEINEKGSN
ncbi:hypothetical protein J6A31_05605 [bacterium]|nr:hypothetical protein [bacterium]